MRGKALGEQLLAIAKKYLSIDTLETRNSDFLDFHDVSVCNIKLALEDDYFAGYRDRAYSEKRINK